MPDNQTDWIEKDNFLFKDFEFPDFKTALSFANKVGDIAERLNHHPTVCLHNYKFLKIETTTHSEKRITAKDYELAEEIDKLLK